MLVLKATSTKLHFPINSPAEISETRKAQSNFPPVSIDRLLALLLSTQSPHTVFRIEKVSDQGQSRVAAPPQSTYWFTGSGSPEKRGRTSCSEREPQDIPRGHGEIKHGVVPPSLWSRWWYQNSAEKEILRCIRRQTLCMAYSLFKMNLKVGSVT